jgi:hypothetical protein
MVLQERDAIRGNRIGDQDMGLAAHDENFSICPLISAQKD